ncbi:MAG: 4Fe-4S binding protein [Candidatus Lokiarchaeota archaeon]|jgi:ferredoxin
MTEVTQPKKVIRKIIEINEDLCTGCGACVVSCAEGALAIIDGKARVVNEVFCDGLGACIGECPEGALKIIEREALEFDEEEVEKYLESIKENIVKENYQCSCPSAQTMVFEEPDDLERLSGSNNSALRQWPIQMHLINPLAPYFKGADILLTADCVAYSLGGYHGNYLRGRSIAIACPKLDQGREGYIEKIRMWIDEAKINTLTVMMMEVPCCTGLLALAKDAANQARRKVPIKYIIVGIKGDILKEEWI